MLYCLHCPTLNKVFLLLLLLLVLLVPSYKNAQKAMFVLTV